MSGDNGSVMMGQLMYHSYSAGFIVLSYFVSVVGSWTALELLHKRTSRNGLYNWYLLLGAATAMGAVAIWAMHFIGNRAITMADGQDDLQIAYSPSYTAGSFFLPICVVGLAFFVFTITDQVTILGTTLGGFTTGFAVCGMHYLGQGGIANYQAVYNWRYIFGAGVIAVVASTLALGIFFYFKAIWTNAWWKRMVCGFMLAVAVSGMHWVATVGTQYRFRAITGGAGTGALSRHATVIVVLSLAIGCCFALLVFALIGQRSRQKYADRAQQVVLACATWDPEGRLMVTPEGLLPCRKITNSYVQRSFEDVFSIEHPVFCWLFRLTRCWPSVTDLVPGMRMHLRSTNIVNSQPNSGAETRADSIDGAEDYSQIFKELFCVAAEDLAAMIQEPLEKIGVLYDEIMSTGTLRRNKAAAAHKTTADIERALPYSVTFGRGQLLFVVRHADKLETSHLQAAGYRFASLSNILDHLARSMQVTSEELRPRLENMRGYAIESKMLEPGVHLVCFALRPLFQRGFDVLVLKNAKNLLPSFQLPVMELQRWQLDFMFRLDNWTVAECLDWLRKPADHFTPDERVFSSQLHKAISSLRKQIDNPFFEQARLIARPLSAPCRNVNGSGPPGQAKIIAFRVMTDVHESRHLNSEVEFIASRFFLCQQHVYSHSPDHSIFGRRVHREFAMLNRCSNRPGLETRNSIVSNKTFGRDLFSNMPASPSLPKWNLSFQRKGADPTGMNSDSSSEKNLVEGQPQNPFGGIHVSNEISIDVHEIRHGERSPDVEMTTLGVTSEAGVAPIERESFVDELLSLTIQERRQAK
ncbi:hypothetical protein MMC25_002007 [Agyrium rufum]|nr:hypothetical protein [Agyrium rufum]